MPDEKVNFEKHANYAKKLSNYTFLGGAGSLLTAYVLEDSPRKKRTTHGKIPARMGIVLIGLSQFSLFVANEFSYCAKKNQSMSSKIKR